MAATKAPGQRSVIYKTAAEFSQVLHEAFAQACRQDPDDPILSRLQNDVKTAEAEGKPEDGEAALRKWYSKRKI